jgi:hypothetical protein
VTVCTNCTNLILQSLKLAYILCYSPTRDGKQRVTVPLDARNLILDLCKAKNTTKVEMRMGQNVTAMGGKNYCES